MIVTFCIFKKCKPTHIPVSVNIEYKNRDNIEKAIHFIANKFQLGEYDDDTKEWFPNSYDGGENNKFNYQIITDLLNNNYYVWNCYKKYYSILYVLDYCRVLITCFGCDFVLVNWGHNYGQLAGVDIDPEPIINKDNYKIHYIKDDY